MRSPDEIDLKEAGSIYAISNTPIFLASKLRSNSAVQLIAQSFGGQQILDSLTRAVAKQPETLQETVRPYAYLVALSLQPNGQFLREAAAIPAPNLRWFSYISALLIQTSNPLTKQNSLVHGFASPTITTSSTTSSSSISSIIVTQGRK